MISLVLFYVFVVCVILQIGYAVVFFSRFFSTKNEAKHPASNLQKATIIVCAKNEFHNLKENLPLMLSQQYWNEKQEVNFEVLVVNDASTDATEELLKALQHKFPHLRFINIAPDAPRLFKGKKFALSKAVAAVETEWILMTDADCQPASSNWLSLMMQPLQEGKAIVCGYGAYREENSFLNRFVRWETLHSFLLMSSFAKAGFPYMAVGRNLACTKSVLQQAQQAAVWNAIPSGDDDLLVQTCGTKKNIALVSHAESFTYSTVKNTWREWSHQKQRHLSTGKFYNPTTQVLIGVYALSHALFWLLSFILFFSSFGKIVLSLFLIRVLLYSVIWVRAAKLLKEKRLTTYLSLCDVSWAIYNFVFSPFIFFKNKQQWK